VCQQFLLKIRCLPPQDRCLHFGFDPARSQLPSEWGALGGYDLYVPVDWKRSMLQALPAVCGRPWLRGRSAPPGTYLHLGARHAPCGELAGIHQPLSAVTLKDMTSANEKSAKLKAFVDWTAAHTQGDEKGEAQVFLDRLFQGFGWPGMKEAGVWPNDYNQEDRGRQ
jgi:hypothetical protein